MHNPENLELAKIAAASYCRYLANKFEDTSSIRGRYIEIAIMFDDGCWEEAWLKLETLERDLAKKGLSK